LIATIEILLKRNPSTCCKEIVEEIKTSFQMTISKQLVHLIIKRLGYSFKRIRKRGQSKKKDQLIVEFKNAYKQIPAGTRIFAIDESGFDNRPLPIYGYALRGQQAILEYKPSTDRKHYSLLMGITNDGSKNYTIFDVSVNSYLFNEFIESLDVPEGSYILLDNASIHKSKYLKQMIEERNAS
jgi:DDE superfamily endonuclease